MREARELLVEGPMELANEPEHQRATGDLTEQHIAAPGASNWPRNGRAGGPATSPRAPPEGGGRAGSATPAAPGPSGVSSAKVTSRSARKTCAGVARMAIEYEPANS